MRVLAVLKKTHICTIITFCGIRGTPRPHLRTRANNLFGYMSKIPNHNFVKLHCDERFTHVFTACGCVFKEITLVDSNQGNYFENATACSKHVRKTQRSFNSYKNNCKPKSGNGGVLPSDGDL